MIWVGLIVLVVIALMALGPTLRQINAEMRFLEEEEERERIAAIVEEMKIAGRNGSPGKVDPKERRVEVAEIALLAGMAVMFGLMIADRD